MLEAAKKYLSDVKGVDPQQFLPVKERGFLTSAGKKIANGDLIAQLLEAIKLPSKVAVIHCKGHQRGEDRVAQGNRRADRAAKEAALKTPVIAPQVIPQCQVPEYKINQREKDKLTRVFVWFFRSLCPVG